MRSFWRQVAGKACAGLAVMAILGWGIPASAAEVTLYDGSLGVTPDMVDWLYVTDPPSGAQAQQTADGEVTILDTTLSMEESAGYFTKVTVSRPPLPPITYEHPDMPMLDTATGYTISFVVQVHQESHDSLDRAGFSVIVIAEDPTRALEVGFWEDEIWAQHDGDPLFTHGEGAAFDTTADLIRYEIGVLGSRYRIIAAGRALLDGVVRDYTAFGEPYTIPSFLFFGDDTSSAQARISLAEVTVRTDEKRLSDVDRDGNVTLTDVIIALRVLAGIDTAGGLHPAAALFADVDGDGAVGQAEALFGLQTVAGLR